MVFYAIYFLDNFFILLGARMDFAIDFHTGFDTNFYLTFSLKYTTIDTVVKMRNRRASVSARGRREI